MNDIKRIGFQFCCGLGFIGFREVKRARIWAAFERHQEPWVHIRVQGLGFRRKLLSMIRDIRSLGCQPVDHDF